MFCNELFTCLWRMSKRESKYLWLRAGEGPFVQLGTLPCKTPHDTGLHIFKAFSFGVVSGLQLLHQQPLRGMKTVISKGFKDFVPPSLHWERIFLAFGGRFFSMHYFWDIWCCPSKQCHSCSAQVPRNWKKKKYIYARISDFINVPEKIADIALSNFPFCTG